MIIKYQNENKIREFTGNMRIDEHLGYRLVHEYINEKGGFYREVAAEYLNRNEAEKVLYEIIESYKSGSRFYELPE